MKILKLTPVLILFVFASCSSVRVVSDYDREANFNSFNSFAFFKPGIDKAEISDLDKKRILRAIEANFAAKGMNKNSNPDLLVSIFTKENERVDVFNNNFGWGGWGGGWGWGGFGWGGWGWGGNWGNTVSRSTEGTLYIDLLDAKTKELVWQGIGRSSLYRGSDIDKKDERIRLIVSEILMEYPPGQQD